MNDFLSSSVFWSYVWGFGVGAFVGSFLYRICRRRWIEKRHYLGRVTNRDNRNKDAEWEE